MDSELVVCAFFLAGGVQQRIGRLLIALLAADAAEKRLIDFLGAGKIGGGHLHIKWARRRLESTVLL